MRLIDTLMTAAAVCKIQQDRVPSVDVLFRSDAEARAFRIALLEALALARKEPVAPKQ
jgi:hypothetical protein